MYRSRGCLLGLIFALFATAVEARAPRTGKRDFPQFARCPVHTGEVGPDDPFSFTATSRTTRLTFLACDDRSPTHPQDPPCPEDPDPNGPPCPRVTALDVSIDDLMVIKRDVFNAPENHLLYPDAVPASYRLSEGCYSETPVSWVFDRSKVSPFTAAMPFADDFETPTRRWTLGNATVEKEAKDPNDAATGNKSLILARAERGEGPGRRRGDLCSIATVTIGGLVRGQDYVVDFSWWVSVNPELVQHQPVLTLFLEERIPQGSRTTPRQAREPATGRAPGVAAKPRR